MVHNGRLFIASISATITYSVIICVILSSCQKITRERDVGKDHINWTSCRLRSHDVFVSWLSSRRNSQHTKVRGGKRCSGDYGESTSLTKRRAIAEVESCHGYSHPCRPTDAWVYSKAAAPIAPSRKQGQERVYK